MRMQKKMDIREILSPEITECIMVKVCTKVIREMGRTAWTMKPEVIFRALRDEVWERLLRKAGRSLEPAASAPNAEQIVCAFLKGGLPRSAVRHRFPGVFTVQLTNSRLEITKVIPTGGGFCYRACPEKPGISPCDIVRLAWWMDSQVPMIRSKADEIIREAKQREMIRKIETIARKNGRTTAYRVAEEET